MTVSVDERQRLNQLAALGGVAGLVVVALSIWLTDWALPSWSVLAAVALLSAAVSASALLMVRHPSRLLYDASTPVIIASAALAGPLAPVVVMLLVKVTAWTVVRHQGWRLAMVNDGVLSLTYLGASLVFRHIPGIASGWSNVGAVLIVAVVVTTATQALNQVLASAGVAHLYGRWPKHIDLMAQARDAVACVVFIVVVWAGPDVLSWLLLPALAFTIIYSGQVARWYREHTAVLHLEAQARVIWAEQGGPNPGHTERMVQVVREHSAFLPARRRTRLESAAWFHSLKLGGTGFRCNGMAHSVELERMVATLPRVRDIHTDPYLREAGYMGSGSKPEAHLLSAACAWDSRLLPSGPIRHPDDLIYIFGIDPRIAAAVTVDD